MSNAGRIELGSVVSLWRYPVKSMMGEELNAAEVTERGLLGDRASPTAHPDAARSGARRPAGPHSRCRSGRLALASLGAPRSRCHDREVDDCRPAPSMFTLGYTRVYSLR